MTFRGREILGFQIRHVRRRKHLVLKQGQRKVHFCYVWSFDLFLFFSTGKCHSYRARKDEMNSDKRKKQQINDFSITRKQTFSWWCSNHRCMSNLQSLVIYWTQTSWYWPTSIYLVWSVCVCLLPIDTHAWKKTENAYFSIWCLCAPCSNATLGKCQYDPHKKRKIYHCLRIPNHHHHCIISVRDIVMGRECFDPKVSICMNWMSWGLFLLVYITILQWYILLIIWSNQLVLFSEISKRLTSFLDAECLMTHTFKATKYPNKLLCCDPFCPPYVCQLLLQVDLPFPWLS